MARLWLVKLVCADALSAVVPLWCYRLWTYKGSGILAVTASPGFLCDGCIAQ